MSIHRSFKYTASIKLQLKLILHKRLNSFKDDILIAATGSLGKMYLTPNSDIDLVVIIDDRHPIIKNQVIRKLKNIRFLHKLELYPIVTLNEWKVIARDSALLCSDLFFAQSIWGNTKLFNNLMSYIEKNNLELKNRFMYFIYNLFYRDIQIEEYKDSDDLKYQPGGLRDFQMFLWIEKRFGKELELINTREKKLLSLYSKVLLTYKWEKELCCSKSKLLLAKNNYESARRLAIPLLKKIKSKVLSEFEKSKGRVWKKYLIASKAGNLNDKNRWELIKSRDEDMIFLGLWRTKNIEIIDYCLEKYSYWTTRCAIALNPYASSEQLHLLSKQNFPDMKDIKMFISKNPRYNL